MKISVITLFPGMFQGVLSSSILKRAQEKGRVVIDLVNLRDFGIGRHRSVDDKPYGGGVGMLMRVDILHKALLEIKKKHKKTFVILLDPSGIPFSQNVAEKLSKKKDVTLLCGHYEGVDARIKEFIDLEISLGDFVLTGGEIPAMTVIDALVRLIPGVLGKDESSYYESFSEEGGKRILEHPHYTRPVVYKFKKKVLKVPEVLLSGDPKKVNEYRAKSSKSETKKKRPDLLS